MMCGVRHEESHDPEEFQEYRILDLFERYPKTLRGLKIRMCKSTLGDYGIAPLQRAVAIANKVEQAGHKCLVAVHYHDLPDNVRLEELLETLRPGDILAHLYQTFGQTIFTPDGKVLPAVRRARERGVIFDSANGRPHWSFSHLQRAFADGFYPDIISSDVLRFSEYGPHGCSLLHAMCVLSAAGMDEGAICRAVTQTPAHVLGVAERAGTLTPGTPADVCILDAMDSDLVFTDQHGGSRQADKMFVPLLTMREGKIAYRQIFYNL